MITIRQDLDAITSILFQTLEILPFKRKYDEAFGQITAILNRYEIIENPRNLRIRFTLCMQEFFDSVPQEINGGQMILLSSNKLKNLQLQNLKNG